MRGDDPDAMWRPGYTGSYGYPTQGAGRRARWPVVATALALAAGAVVVVAQPVRVDRQAAAGSRVGVGAEVRWQTDLDGITVTGAAGSAEGLVVLAGPAGPDIVALDATTGRQRWHLDLPPGRIDSVDVIDDVVVVSQALKGDAAAVAGVPVATGEIAWTHSIDRYDTVADEGGGIVALVSAGRVELLNVHDGTTSAAVEGDVSWSRSVSQRRRGGRVEVLDRTTLRPIAAVDLALLGLDHDVEASVAATPGGIVVATPTQVLLLDADGRILRDALSVPPGGGVGLEVLDDAGRYVAVQQGDRLALLTTADGDLRELWSDVAWLVDWRIDPTHRLVAVAPVIGSIISMPPVVLDAESGRPLWDGPAVVQQSSPLQVFADDGFVRISSDGGLGRLPVVVGYDLDRREVWRRPVESASRVHVIDRGFVTIDDGTGPGATITLYA